MKGLLVLAGRSSDGSSLSLPPLTSFPSGLVTPPVKNEILGSKASPRICTHRGKKQGREREQDCLHSLCLGLFLPSPLYIQFFGPFSVSWDCTATHIYGLYMLSPGSFLKLFISSKLLK